MSDLIERLKKATGPDRDLDLAIGEAVGAADHSGPAYHRPFREWAKHYTTSIDAALTLVPPQCWGEISWAGVLGLKENPRSYPIVTLGPGEDGQETQSATIPIALCIAALKARAALAPHEGEP